MEIVDNASLSAQLQVEDIMGVRGALRTNLRYGFLGLMGSASLLRSAQLEKELENAKGEDLVRLTRMKESGSFRYADSAFEFARGWQRFYYQEQPDLMKSAFEALDPATRDRELRTARVPLVTGGGPGIMGAVTAGIADVNLEAGQSAPAHSIAGTFEKSNPSSFSTYRCADLSIREAELINRSHILLVWPGGYGTLWELTEYLSKLNTNNLSRLVNRLVLVHADFWIPVLEGMNTFARSGTINTKDDFLSYSGEDQRVLTHDEKRPSIVIREPFDPARHLGVLVDTPEQALNFCRTRVSELAMAGKLRQSF